MLKRLVPDGRFYPIEWACYPETLELRSEIAEVFLANIATSEEGSRFLSSKIDCRRPIFYVQCLATRSVKLYSRPYPPHLIGLPPGRAREGWTYIPVTARLDLIVHCPCLLHGSSPKLVMIPMNGTNFQDDIATGRFWWGFCTVCNAHYWSEQPLLPKLFGLRPAPEEAVTPSSLRELLGNCATDGAAEFDGEGKWKAKRGGGHG